jgi:predicted ATPase
LDLEDGGERLSVDQLSSGERHLLVLFYWLAFETSDVALMMIDEPEISLHVAWQNLFTNTLSKLVGDSGSRFLVATHSPTIVRTQFDMVVKPTTRLSQSD